PDSTYSQHLCDFILSLSLAFNDVRDLLVAHDILNVVWPKDETKPTCELGEFTGLTQHMFRLHLGTLHEVLRLVEDNKSVMADAAFVATVKKMKAEARNAWAT